MALTRTEIFLPASSAPLQLPGLCLQSSGLFFFFFPAYHACAAIFLKPRDLRFESLSSAEEASPAVDLSPVLIVPDYGCCPQETYIWRFGLNLSVASLSFPSFLSSTALIRCSKISFARFFFGAISLAVLLFFFMGRPSSRFDGKVFRAFFVGFVHDRIAARGPRLTVTWNFRLKFPLKR